MMLRSFVWVFAVGPIIATAGCSDPVPVSAAVGLRVSVSNTPSCPLNTTIPPPSIGNPPPDSTSSSGAGKRVYSGEGGLTASCRVRDVGGGSFTVSGSMQAPGSYASFNVDGSVAGAAGPAAISLYTSLIGTTVTSPTDRPCTLSVVSTSNGPEVHPGSVWARFDCPTLVGAPNPICTASGEFVLENCEK
jgi:hypothetical protein